MKCLKFGLIPSVNNESEKKGKFLRTVAHSWHQPFEKLKNCTDSPVKGKVKIDDLYLAYQFASENKPDKETFAKMHKLLARHIVSTNWLGKFWNQNMFVTTKDGRIEYVTASPSEVISEMNKLYADLEVLLASELTISETFFFASMLHLVLVKIHPWNDGNGRSARLFEKWFLAQKLGNKAWFVQSEKNYYVQHETYYNNIRALGLEYPTLDYSKALPFLLMLPESVTAQE